MTAPENQIKCRIPLGKNSEVPRVAPTTFRMSRGNYILPGNKSPQKARPYSGTGPDEQRLKAWHDAGARKPNADLEGRGKPASRLGPGGWLGRRPQAWAECAAGPLAHPR